MKAELGLFPVYGWFCHKFQPVFVRRERGPSALRRLMRDAKARVAAGRGIPHFPPGHPRAPGAAADHKQGPRAPHAI